MLLPGYGQDANGTVYRCPLNTYSLGNITAPASCQPCGEGLVTQAEGSVSEAACLAPPGSGYDAESRSAVPCSVGSYNSGWIRSPCTSCGRGLTTGGLSSTARGDCLVPPGWGADYTGQGSYRAYPCPADWYGQSVVHSAEDRFQCLMCPELTTTFGAMGATSHTRCVTQPGENRGTNKKGWAGGNPGVGRLF